MTVRAAPVARSIAASARNLARPVRASTARGAVPPSPMHPIRSAVAQALRSPGRPLDPGLRGFFERSIGRVEAATTEAPFMPVALSSRLSSRGDDSLEREADRAADRVGQVAATNASLAGLAAPMTGAKQTAFRPDFGRVRVHTGPAASAASQALRAHAFSIGDDVVFGESGFRPLHERGLRLLAHELAHVAQRVGGRLMRKGMADQDLPTTPSDSDIDDKEDSPEAVALQSPLAETPAPDTGGAPGPAAPAVAAAPASVVAGAPSKGAALGAAPGTERAGAEPKAPQSPGELASGELGLIDEELAEHEKWGAAAQKVGATGSGQRAAFIADEAGGGAAKGFKEGVVQGAKSAIAMKIAEKAIAKVAVAVATKLGAQAARFTPLPGIGAVIGGVMAGIELAKRDWGATGKTIAGFGKGADTYEQLANSLEAISTVIEVATQVANVIAGILGAITVIMWIAAVATAGVISPMAATLTTISLAIGIGTMVLDGINALVLKQLITMFRALHAFASDADPRDVVAQGEAIEGAAGAATGFVGGLVGAKAAEVGGHLVTPKKPPKVPGHPNPPAAGGEGPVVKGEPPVERIGADAKPAVPSEPARPSVPEIPKAGAVEVEAVPAKAPAAPGAEPAAAPPVAKPVEAAPAGPVPAAEHVEAPKSTVAAEPAAKRAPPAAPEAHGPVDERSFAGLDDVVASVNESPFGEGLQAEKARLDAAPRTPVNKLGIKQARAEAKPAQQAFRETHGLQGRELQAGHTEAVRHTAESGAPGSQVNDQAKFQILHSKRGKGLDVTVTDQHGVEKITTRHRAQEGLIDAGVDRARSQGGGTLTPEGQADAGREVRWRTEGTGFDQREVQTKRSSGLFDEQSAIEGSAAVKQQRARAAAGAGDALPATRGTAAAVPPEAATTPPVVGPSVPVPGNAPALLAPEPIGPNSSPPTSAASPPGSEGSGGGAGGGKSGGAGKGGGGDGGGGPPEISEARQAFAEEVVAKERMVGGPLVEPEFAAGIADQRPQAMRRGESALVGRSQVSDRVKNDQRARAAKAFGKQMQAALQDEGKHTALTQKTLEHLTPAQREAVLETGRMPEGFEFHHLMAIADYPEFGHLPETGLSLPKDVHRQAGHGGDTTRPLEAATLIDPGAMERPGFTFDEEAAKGHRAKAADVASGKSALSEKRGGIDADLLTERRAKIQALKRRRLPQPGDAAEIARLQGELSTIEQLIAKAAAKPPGGSPPSTGGPATAPEAPSSATSPAQNAASPSTGAPDAENPAGPSRESTPLSPKSSGAAGGTGQGATPKSDAAATPTTASAEPAVAAPGRSVPAPAPTPSDTVVPATVATKAAAPLPAVAPASTKDDAKGDVAPAAGGDAPAATSPSSAPPQAAAPAPPLAHTVPDGPAGPIVERVNPAYRPPPGTPDDLASLRNQIIDTLYARSLAEQHAQAMGQQKKHHEANEKPLADMKGGTDEALTATKAHQEAVARRDEANQRKKAEEDKAHSTVDDYASRAGRLTSLTLPLRGLARFTGLAHSLPGEPDFVLRFRTGVLKMNTDSTKFLSQLDQMDATMAEQKAQQGERQKGIAADGSTLKQTDQKADKSAQALQDAKETNADFDKNNQERKEDATQQQKGAQQTAGSLAVQARSKEQQAVSLAAAMQFWAHGHAAARATAIEQTKKRLVSMGYRVTEVREK